MNPHFLRQFIALFSRKEKAIDDVDDNIDPDGLEATLNAPSLITSIENFEPMLSSTYQDRLIAFATDATNASLDFTNRVVIGKRCGMGAQADVFEGRLLTNDANLSVIQRKMKDKKRFHIYLRKHPGVFTKAAVKQPRYYRFLEDGDKAAKVCSCGCLVTDKCNNILTQQTFLRESQAWTGLKHPNILRLRGYALVNGVPSFVSDWMDQGSLRNFRATNPQLDAKSMVR